VNEIRRMLENNRVWAGRMRVERPELFGKLAQRQTPRCLWIGCSDSRVPAEFIVQLSPGDLFVHRNIANLVSDADINSQSVLQYAVDVLQVGYVIICGHHGCGGVRASLGNAPGGAIGRWLQPLRQLADTNGRELDGLPNEDAQVDRLSELNVVAQVRNVCHGDILQSAWRRGQSVRVLGWVYGLNDGLLRDLGVGVSDPSELQALEGGGGDVE
jgi:carbonic anhydrase